MQRSHVLNEIWDINTLSWARMKQPILEAGNVTIGGTVAVSNFPATQPISAVSLPLPTGAATQTTLASLFTELQAKADLTETQPIAVKSTSFATRSDTFTGPGNGTIISAVAAPLQWFAVQVKGTGAAATLWSVFLEGSLDGVNFSFILNHVTATTDGAVLWLGDIPSPVLYIRSRCASLTLGSATNIVVTILGTA